MYKIGSKAYIYSEILCRDEENLFFYDDSVNTLMQIKSDGQVLSVCTFNKEKAGGGIFGTIAKFGNRIMAIRLGGIKSYIVDCSTGASEIFGEVDDISQELKSCSVFIEGDKAYIVSIKRPMIAIYDISENCFEYIYVPEKLYVFKKIDVFCLFAVMDAHRILIPLYDGSGILGFDMNTRSYSWILKIDYKGYISSMIKVCENKYILCARNVAELIVVSTNNATEKNNIDVIEDTNGNVGFRRIWKDDNGIFLLKEKKSGVSKLITDDEKNLKIEPVSEAFFKSRNAPVIGLLIDSDNDLVSDNCIFYEKKDLGLEKMIESI